MTDYGRLRQETDPTEVPLDKTPIGGKRLRQNLRSRFFPAEFRAARTTALVTIQAELAVAEFNGAETATDIANRGFALLELICFERSFRHISK
jgi:hypothetical protein